MAKRLTLVCFERLHCIYIISSFQKVCDSLGGPATEETLLLMSV